MNFVLNKIGKCESYEIDIIIFFLQHAMMLLIPTFLYAKNAFARVWTLGGSPLDVLCCLLYRFCMLQKEKK